MLGFLDGAFNAATAQNVCPRHHVLELDAYGIGVCCLAVTDHTWRFCRGTPARSDRPRVRPRLLAFEGYGRQLSQRVDQTVQRTNRSVRGFARYGTGSRPER